MTMNAMCDYLSARGFVVRKSYNRSTKSYVFDVGRDGRILRQFFKYPVDVKPVVRDRIQREFLDDIIKQFNGVELRYVGDLDEYGVVSATEIIKQLTQGKGEREMATRKINWKVGEMQAETSSDGRFIYTQLVGVPDPLFCGSFSDVKNDLQRYMDKYMTEDDRTMYLSSDVANTYSLWIKQNTQVHQVIPSIENVVFNNPATIVFWKDGTKTVVKCQNDDVFDPEKGLAMAIVKKVLGNKGNYCNEIKKWLPEDKPKTTTADKNNQEYCTLQAAYHVLYPTLHNPKATKKEMTEVMEEALGYIGEVLDK